ncbi:MAG: hypothetical protein VCA57_06545 [Pseudomonas sp.]|uniref:hypothetical protein n=1 Tax=Pseudomonas sp. TaxID=306 RepID=UPI0039819EDD
MNIKGTLGALLVAPLFVTLAGCLPQNTQPQGLQNAQATNANGPCTPSATSELVATGRSLLQLTNSLLETQQSFTGSSASYAQRVQVAENAQRLNQGNNMLNGVENLTGKVGSLAGNAPCTEGATANASQ